MICEEWRDYHYNQSTGEFIDWAGPSYWVCRMEDEPISTPESPLPDYDGGFGTPLPDNHDSRCRSCRRQRKSCEDSVDNGREQCAMDQGRYWHNVCATDLRFRGGQRIPQSHRLEAKGTYAQDGKTHTLLNMAHLHSPASPRSVSISGG